MEGYHIAVFDIGKTNKKLILFDADLNILKIERSQIREYTIDNMHHDDINGIEAWMIQTLKHNAGQFNIKVISISAHGATFTCVDEAGNLAVPELSYTTDPGEDFHKAFFEEMGSREMLQETTCTPDFKVLLNVAKGIKFVKERYGDQFHHTRHILNLPQHFSYKLTGKVSADPTNVGCHSYLWDFRRHTWSKVVDKLDIRSRLPEKLMAPWEPVGKITKEVAGKTGLSEETIVTTGIHDSNASLLPHIISSEGKDFILNSTGTWCVIMHERDEVQFNRDELGKVVFYNLSAFGRPVKTAIFMGGLEFEAYDSLLSEKGGDHCLFREDLYREIIRKKELFILPGITHGTGQFPQSHPRIIEGGKVYPFEAIRSGESVPHFFKDNETAYAVLNLSLAIQTKVSLDRVDMQDGLPIFTEGGFSNNDAYNILVSAFYPRTDVYLTNLQEATAYGAALVGKAALEGSDPRKYRDLLDIERIPVRKLNLEGLREYTEKFLSQV